MFRAHRHRFGTDSMPMGTRVRAEVVGAGRRAQPARTPPPRRRLEPLKPAPGRATLPRLGRFGPSSLRRKGPNRGLRLDFRSSARRVRDALRITTQSRSAASSPPAARGAVRRARAGRLRAPGPDRAAQAHRRRARRHARSSLASRRLVSRAPATARRPAADAAVPGQPPPPGGKGAAVGLPGDVSPLRSSSPRSASRADPSPRVRRCQHPPGEGPGRRHGLRAAQGSAPAPRTRYLRARSRPSDSRRPPRQRPVGRYRRAPRDPVRNGRAPGRPRTRRRPHELVSRTRA
jgi:hypothetical protein